MKIEGEEIKNFALALIFLTFVWSFPKLNPIYIAISFLIILISFVPHELAHRYFARKFGYVAFFQLWPFGMIIGIILLTISFGNIKFLAPGAVIIYPIAFRGGYLISRYISARENSIISASGPIVNIAISIISSLLFLQTGFLLLRLLAQVNAWLALFNLLPIMPLDGSKIFNYNFYHWLSLFVVSLVIFLFSTYVA